MRKLKVFSVLSASIALLSIFGCASSTPFTPFVEPPLPKVGTTVPGENLTEKLAWLEKNADSRNIYILDVKANENIAPRTLEYAGATGITIVLRGVGENRTIRLASHGTMFTIKSEVFLVLDNNITLQGHSQNTGPMVNVDGGGFWMRSGSSIIGNERGSGDGGGVYVRTGNFSMSGGIISGNTAENGGGVYVWGWGIHGAMNTSGTFKMLCGTISDNIANNQGGGVYSNSYSIKKFVAYGAVQTDIVSNFRMGNDNSGCAIITGNTARKEGGGVYRTYGVGAFINHGVVTGYESDPDGGNVVRDEAGSVVSDKGHATRAGNCKNSDGRFVGPCGNSKTIGKKTWSDAGSSEPNALSEKPAILPPPPPATTATAVEPPATPAIPAEPIAPPEAVTQASVETPAPPPSIPPSSEATFVDSRDGKTYKKVTIGTQTWMAENLDYAGLYDANVGWNLYNWSTAKKACPAGWHLPSGAEWTTLVEYVGGVSVAGKKLKSKTNWNGTDEYGFSATPGGFYDGGFEADDEPPSGLWWSSTEKDANESWYFVMRYDEDKVRRYTISKEGIFFSVRCVQD